jgi:hypothetical protein
MVLRGPSPSTVLEPMPTFSQTVFNLDPAVVCLDPSSPKVRPFARQTIWYVTGACTYDTNTTDVSVSCDPISGNATFAVYPRGNGCKGAPFSPLPSPHPVVALGGVDKAMTVVGKCSKNN